MFQNYITMKKLLALLVMVAMLLPSCQKIEDRIDGLENRIDQIEGTQIATINQQIEAINTTLPQLRETDAELKEYIQSLQTTATNLQEQITNTNKDINELEAALNKAIADAEASDDALKAELVAQLNTVKADILAHLESTKTALEAELAHINSTIATLQAKDTELEGKITTLEEYVNTELQNTEDWATATFTTLEQYNTIIEDIATIKTQIETLNASLTNLEERLNSKIATDIATAVEGLQSELATKVTEVTTAYTDAISTAKEEITSAYTEAIATAIANLELSMKEWVNEQLTGYYTIAEADALLLALKSELEGSLASQKSYLEELINNLSTSLTTQITTNKELIDALRADVTTAESNIATNAEAIAENSAKILANVEAIAENSEDIVANEQLIAENKTLIEENTALIDENKGAITNLEKDVAENAEAIANNAALIAQNATAINNNAQAISDNAAAIAQLRTDLATTKDEITEAYTEAITTAISTLDGELRDQIATEVATINNRIDNEVKAINTAIASLTERVATLEKEVEEIQTSLTEIREDIDKIREDISNLMERIQSISYIPKYSDGRATLRYIQDEGYLSLDFEVSPKDVLPNLVDNWESMLSVKAVQTETRAVDFISMPIISFNADVNNGIISVVVSGDNLLAQYSDDDMSASVAMVISDGNNSVISEYVPLYFKEATDELWYTSTDGNVVMPNVGAFNVNIISNNYYNGRGIIQLDDELKEIGDSAFKNCDNLKTIIIGKSILSIGKYAFSDCDSLSQIVVPGNVEAIGYKAFENCANVSSIILEAGNTNLRLSYSFDGIPSTTLYVDRNIYGGYNNSPFENVGITTISIGPNMRNIDMFVFSNCKDIQGFTIDKNSHLESIGYFAFYNSTITGLHIPDSVTNIDSTAFAMTSGMGWFTSDSIYGVGINGELYGYEESLKTLLRWPDEFSYSTVVISSNSGYDKIGPYSFSGIDVLKYVQVVIYDDTAIEIGDAAFYGCKNLENFESEHYGKMNITTIGGSVFAYTAIKELNFLDSSFNTINGTFRNCLNLKTLYLPKTVTQIGEGAFENCDNLANIFIAATIPPSLSVDAFNIISDVLIIYVPMESVDAYKSAEGWSQYADQIVGFDFENGVVAE